MVSAVIVGAGPYGLSVAAHFRQQGIGFRIFGRPMDSWAAHMPKGMLLKSDGFASNLDSPNDEFTLAQFCAERGIAYADSGIPVRLDTFIEYGIAFKNRIVPELEEKLVVSVDRSPEGFAIKLDTGETVQTQRVVLAVGISYFEYVPDNLATLPPQFLSHSAAHSEVEPFRGRNVVVIGAGSSALDLAGLLHEAGADVQLVARAQELKYHGKPTGKPRSLWQQIRHPKSGLGPGWRSLFYAQAPWLYHYLPEKLRLSVAARALGPSGGGFIRDKVEGKVPCLLGHTVLGADVQDNKVLLRLKSDDGSTREILTDHIIAATGFVVDLERLSLLSPAIRSSIKTVEGTPVLSSSFESSVPGLYFIGLPALNSFGPSMRFAVGIAFAARTVTQAFAKFASRSSAPVQVPVAARSK